MTEREDQPYSEQTRREFCVRACQTVSLVTLGSMLHGCGGGGSPTSPSDPSAPLLPMVSAAVANGQITLTIDPASPLSAVGSAALVQTSAGGFLVAHTAQDSFTALTAICTHEACTITGFQNQRYVCPCHGSQYNTSGGVLTGPAPRALRQFPTQFASGVLTITI